MGQPLKLRPYQHDAIHGVIQTLKTARSGLVVMPTGTGKTVVLSHIVKMSTRGRVLVIAHREELIEQLAATLRVLGLEVGVEMAERRSTESFWSAPQVVVGTIQSLCASHSRRLKEVVDQPRLWSLTIIDEAHHAAAATYRELVQHMQQNTNHKVLGVTATPDRHDGLAMASVFDQVAYEYRIDDAIQDGWLVPIKQKTVYVDSLDYDVVDSHSGDLVGSQLAKVMEEETTLQKMVAPTYEIAGERRTVMFCTSVDQAKRCCEAFNRREPDCARVVHGKTPKAERRQMFDEFKAGRFRFLCNCMIATEGWDCPEVEVVVVGRPTKSRALYTQMVGRGLRPLPGLVDQCAADQGSAGHRRAAIDTSPKRFCEVLDFVGAATRHKLISPVDILGGRFPEAVIDRANEIAREARDDVDPNDALLLAEEQLRAEAEEKERLATARRAKLIAKARYVAKEFNPFDVLDIAPPRMTYDGPSTEKQCEFLMKQGIDATQMSKAEATKLQRTIFSRIKRGMCTVKQARLLKKYGYDGDVSKAEATRLIDALAANGWRKPA